MGSLRENKGILARIKQIFNKPEDIFPSDIGKEKDFSQQTFLIGEKGVIIPVTKPSSNEYSVYYCWWD